MKNGIKIGLVVIILLVLIILSRGIIKGDKSEVKNNSLQQEKIMETKEDLKGSGIYNIDLTSSKINWEGKKTFIKDWVDTGSIDIQSGSITLSDDKITEGKILVDMNSISVHKTGMGKGEDMLSKHLKSEDFFNIESFPVSQFSLTSLTPIENKYEYTAKGNMTIKNITKPIEFPITIHMTNSLIYMSGEVVIDRTLFDIKYGSTNFFKDIGDKAVNNNFKLKLELIANKA